MAVALPRQLGQLTNIFSLTTLGGVNFQHCVNRVRVVLVCFGPWLWTTRKRRGFLLECQQSHCRRYHRHRHRHRHRPSQRSCKHRHARLQLATSSFTCTLASSLVSLKQEPRDRPKRRCGTMPAAGNFFSSLIWECSLIVNLSKRSTHLKNTKHTQISGTSSLGA